MVGRHSIRRRENGTDNGKSEMLHWAFIPIKLGMAQALIFDGYTLGEG